MHRYIGTFARPELFKGLLYESKSLLLLFETCLLLLLLLLLNHLEVCDVVKFRFGLLFFLHQDRTMLFEFVVEGRLLAPHFYQLLKVQLLV